MTHFSFFTLKSANKAFRYLQTDPRMADPEYLEANGYGQIIDVPSHERRQAHTEVK